MFYSPARWRSKSVVVAKREFEKLPSQTAKRNSVKEQIRIRVKGFGRTDISFGLGWGRLAGKGQAKNPLRLVSDRFSVRASDVAAWSKAKFSNA